MNLDSNRKYFRIYTTSWTFVFKNGKEIVLNVLQDSTVTTRQDGTTLITFVQANFDVEGLKLLKDNVKIESLKETFPIYSNPLKDEEGIYRGKFSFYYDNAEIESITYKNGNDSSTLIEIKLKTTLSDDFFGETNTIEK